MNNKNATFQWAQLFALTAVHFLIDMFGGMLPAIQPAIEVKFMLSVGLAAAIWPILNIACNGSQLFTGHLRSDKERPLFLQLGLILATAMCFLAIVPKSADFYPMLILLAIISGFGIAISHPESLRAIHNLDGISPSVSTAIFMTGGFFGFASGNWVSAYLVSRFGLSGLYFLFICPVIGVIILSTLKIRLAVESKANIENQLEDGPKQIPFWSLFVMAVPAAIASTIIIGILPTVLNRCGFELTFGGLSIMSFGIAASLGSLFWAVAAHKKGQLISSIFALLLGVPFLLVYLMFIDQRSALFILAGAGFCSAAAYPLIVAMSRYAKGPTLGQRMGFIVGGVWGIGSIVLMMLVPIAGKIGFDRVLMIAPVGYTLSAAVGIFVMLKEKKRAFDSKGSDDKL